MSHISLTYHLVFGTYRRMAAIDESHEKELYKFMYDYSVRRGAFVWRIGGMPDHVHILCDIPAKVAVASFVQTLKTESSKFMRVNGHFPLWRAWADRYGAFSVDASSRESIRRYIIGQKEHHRSQSFVEEYRKLLMNAGIHGETVMLGNDC